ncbi:hypothetical protein [Mycobacterium sp.]|uniref:hypothetical protein n=1 Tax=Mycobacterium sp. TaxID=1785 RepID=UPI003C70C8B2
MFFVATAPSQGGRINLSPKGYRDIRTIIVVDIDRIADACGFAVPYHRLVDERPVLDAHQGKASDDDFARLADRNRRSIDGLPAPDSDHPLPRWRA